jgi:hypothetical protein
VHRRILALRVAQVRGTRPPTLSISCHAFSRPSSHIMNSRDRSHSLSAILLEPFGKRLIQGRQRRMRVRITRGAFPYQAADIQCPGEGPAVIIAANLDPSVLNPPRHVWIQGSKGINGRRYSTTRQCSLFCQGESSARGVEGSLVAPSEFYQVAPASPFNCLSSLKPKGYIRSFGYHFNLLRVTIIPP